MRFRMTVWYAGLLAGALVIFGLSVYLGLQQYLYWKLRSTLASECRTIGTELLPQLPGKRSGWLATEINEDYAADLNGRFIRVVKEGAGVVYVSAPPKGGAFDASQVPPPPANDKATTRNVRLPGGFELLITALPFTTPDGSHFVVES